MPRPMCRGRGAVCRGAGRACETCEPDIRSDANMQGRGLPTKYLSKLSNDTRILQVCVWGGGGLAQQTIL